MNELFSATGLLSQVFFTDLALQELDSICLFNRTIYDSARLENTVWDETLGNLALGP